MVAQCFLRVTRLLRNSSCSLTLSIFQLITTMKTSGVKCAEAAEKLHRESKCEFVCMHLSLSPSSYSLPLSISLRFSLLFWFGRCVFGECEMDIAHPLRGSGGGWGLSHKSKRRAIERTTRLTLREDESEGGREGQEWDRERGFGDVRKEGKKGDYHRMREVCAKLPLCVMFGVSARCERCVQCVRCMWCVVHNTYFKIRREMCEVKG